MRSRNNDSVTAREVYDHAAGVIQEHLRLRDYSRTCTVTTLLSVLFFAASRLKSIHDACQRLLRAPDDDTVRKALLAMLPDRRELERRLNRALSDRLPKSLVRKRRPLAIDITEIPYHGQPFREEREICRGRPKHGTTHFHCYATLYVIRRGERFTVAMTYVSQNDELPDVLRRLLQRASQLGVKPRYLLLDRGFYSVDVVRYLQAARYPFLMPVVHRGRKSKRKLEELQGTRRFLARKKSGWSTHQMRNKNKTAQVQICIACDNYAGKWKKRGRRTLVYAYWGFQPGSPQWVRETYRMRFGIETSYRQMNEARIRTCSRKPILRLFFVGLALILRNAWVWIHLTILSGRHRNGRLILKLERLRLSTLLLDLQRYAEALLGCREAIGLQLQQ